MAIITKDSQIIASMPADNLAHWIEENELNADDLEITFTMAESKVSVRAKIRQDAGDPESLLGTTSDVAALGMLHDMVTIVAEAQSGGDFAKFVQIKHGLMSKIAGDAQFDDLAADFLEKVNSGEVMIPVMAKGLSRAFAEIADRSTAVTNALQAA